MTTHPNNNLIREFFRAMNQDKEAAISQFVADQDLMDHIHLFDAAFPDYQLTITDSVAEGDLVAVRFTFRAGHNGTFMGIPPSYNKVEVPVTAFYRIAEGKVVDNWVQPDSLSLMQQIGAVPAPATAS